MKRRTNNYAYDTDTAERYGRHVIDDGSYDDLYRTQRGGHFLHHVTASNESIEPITESDAREWADAHMTENEQLALFDDHTGSRTTTTMTLPDSVLSLLADLAKRTGRSKNQIIAAALRQYAESCGDAQMKKT